MSLADIAEVINVYRKKQEDESRLRLKEQACISYTNACLTAIALYNPKKLPSTVEEAYPNLFGMKQKSQDWREIKAYMQNFSRQRKNMIKTGGKV